MKTKPFEHQQTDFDRTKELQIFAVWWEQGLGKSKLIIDTVCHLHLHKDLTGLLVIAPNGVHGNFLMQEWPVHVWDGIDWVGHVHYTSKAGTRAGKSGAEKVCDSGKKLAVLVMSYDAVRTKVGFDLATRFLKAHRAMMLLDESTAIADPGTERSKRIAKLGPMAVYRRVMSGTPVAEGPFKIFNQMKFLDVNYWKNYGYTSFFVFKQSFALFKTQRAAQGHQFQQLLRYQNLDYLQKLIADHSSRVLKEDALDLPPKLYSRVEFELDPKQRKIYDDLVNTLRAEIDAEHTLEAATALIRLTRLQQITSGFVVAGEMPPPAIGDVVQYATPDNSGVLVGEITNLDGDNALCLGTLTHGETATENQVFQVDLKLPGVARLVAANPKTIEIFEKPADNPRLDALLTILEPITHKVIIWARFRKDIDLICNALGDKAVRYDGAVNDAGRLAALDRFRNDDSVRYFVANPAAISMGVTLTQAKTVIYYSNTFQLEKRLQSEDRAHRIGQDVSVNIIDMVATDTVDEHIVATLRKKFDLAASVVGDRLREWLK